MQIGTRHRQAARAGAGGQGQPVIGQHRAVFQPHASFVAVDLDDSPAEHQLDLLLAEESLGADRQHRLVSLAQQISLGQRRPLIGEMRFGRQQANAPVIARLARADDDVDGGVGSADDEKSAHH